jgi:hypothetical protein
MEGLLEEEQHLPHGCHTRALLFKCTKDFNKLEATTSQEKMIQPKKYV